MSNQQKDTTLEELLKMILGECIGHGYIDHMKGLAEPTPECKDFFYLKLTEIKTLLSQELSKKDEVWREKILEIIGSNEDTDCKDLNRKIYNTYLTGISRAGRNELREQQRKQLDALSKEGGKLD